MQKLIIVDAEQNIIEEVAEIINMHLPEVHIVATAGSVRKGITIIKQFNPDIVLLDIQMPDGDSFELLKKLNYMDFKIIFITAHEEYALEAIKYRAIDYVLKPIRVNEIVNAITKAMKTVGHRYSSMVFEAYQTKDNNYLKQKKIILKTMNSIYSVNVNDIIRLESDGNYSKFFLNNGQKILVSNILKEYEELLHEYGFFRTHQSHLINLEYLVQFKKDEGGIAILKDGSTVPVSLRKKEMLMQTIKNL